MKDKEGIEKILQNSGHKQYPWEFWFTNTHVNFNRIETFEIVCHMTRKKKS